MMTGYRTSRLGAMQPIICIKCTWDVPNWSTCPCVRHDRAEALTKEALSAGVASNHIGELVSVVYYCRMRRPGDELSSRHVLRGIQGFYAHRTMELIRQPTFSLSPCINLSRCLCTFIFFLFHHRAVKTWVDQVVYLIVGEEKGALLGA